MEVPSRQATGPIDADAGASGPTGPLCGVLLGPNLEEESFPSWDHPRRPFFLLVLCDLGAAPLEQNALGSTYGTKHTTLIARQSDAGVGSRL